VEFRRSRYAVEKIVKSPSKGLDRLDQNKGIEGKF